MSCSVNSNKRCKKGKGRQKVEMAKIQNESSLQVTFSKRRAGLFKKASELATLCAAETAVVVFSPGNKPHSFGHPDVETVFNRFLSQKNVLETPRSEADRLLEAHRRASLNQETLELSHLQHQLEMERKRARELDGQRPRWCGPDPDYAELGRLEKALVGFKDQFEARVCHGGRLGSRSLLGPRGSSPGDGGPAEYDRTPTTASDSSILIPYSSSPPTSANN